MIDHGIGRAEQEHACAAFLRQARDVVEKIGGRDTLRKRRLVKETRDKNQRHAVRMDQIRSEKQLARLRMPRAHREHLSIRGSEDERRLSRVSTLARDIDHERRRPRPVHHCNGQAADHDDRHVPSRFVGRTEMKAAN